MIVENHQKVKLPALKGGASPQFRSAEGMGVSFQDRNPKDASPPYRPHLRHSRVPGQAQRRSLIHATLRCGAATIIMWHFGAVPTTTGQMVVGLKRDPHAPALKSGAFWYDL
jgi:hypothetical protein